MSHHVLEANSIMLEFNGIKVLRDVYIQCQTGDVVGLLGQNGQGKSCLMNVIYGTRMTPNGMVCMDGNRINRMFQYPHFLTYLPQYNFIPKHLRLIKIFSTYGINYDEFIESFQELNGKEKYRIGNLSGGQQRLIEAYCIIKTNSYFSILDEPFTNLMPIHIEKLINIIRKNKNKKGFLISDHMYRYITRLCNGFYVLTNGVLYRTSNIEGIRKLGYIPRESFL